MGIKSPSPALLTLLEERLPRVYPTEWNKAVFDGLDRQLEVALSLGILEKRPSGRFIQEI